MKPRFKPQPLVFAALFCSTSHAAVQSEPTQHQPLNIHAVLMFIVFAMLTIAITFWAARRTRSANDYYAAGGGISGFKNGLAIAGDYLSAATLLGLTSLVFTEGLDGFIYAICFYAGWPLILFLMAERLRNLGRYTLADIVACRLDQKHVRITTALGSLTVVVFYLIAQMVGAGHLIKLLFGLDYWVAEIVVGTLMIVYVTFGGMLATTWVQIIKAALLLTGGTGLMVMAFSQFGFNPETLAREAISAHPRGIHIMAPGLLLSDPINAISLSVGLMFGTAGLPHILMRFFTVPDARQARLSVFYATGFIGFFYCVVAVLGFSAIVIVGGNREYYVQTDSGLELIGGSNMVAMHLAHAVGGDVFLGFLAAVAFATILAVVAGLTLAGASAISHDIFANVIMRGSATEAQELRVSRLASVALGLVAVMLGTVFEKHNIAFLVGLTFGIAASANFPILVLSMYWKGLTTRGAVCGSVAGLLSALLLVTLSGAVWVTVLGHSAPLFPYEQPALFSMPIAFAVTVLVSVFDHSQRAARERDAFEGVYIRSQTGLGAIGQR